MTRRKTAALHAPQTEAEAIAQLHEYAQADAAIATIDAETSAAVADIKKAADLRKLPLKDRLAAIKTSLSIWWAVAKGGIAGERRRSAELAGCRLGEKLGNPYVKVKRGIDQAALAAELREVVDCGGLVRTVYELDKPAILRAFASTHADDVARKASCIALGITVEQDDEFFVERLAAAAVETPAVAATSDERRAA